MRLFLYFFLFYKALKYSQVLMSFILNGLMWIEVFAGNLCKILVIMCTLDKIVYVLY